MKTIVIFISFAITLSSKTYACLNGASMSLKDGTFLYEDAQGNVPYGHIFNNERGFQEAIKEVDKLYKETKDIDYLSDKGLLLILLKQYDRAIKLYLKIEKISPDRYSTASNIGTAYELLGDNENALKWIEKAVRIDNTSHENSEWIHVNILKAKIKGEKLYTSSFLLNTDFGTEKIPTSSLTKAELLKLSDALYYQLNERVSFIEPKDKIVAQLLFDLGNIAYLLKRYSDANSDYYLAKKYGLSTQLIDNRINQNQKLLNFKKMTSVIDESSGQPNYVLIGVVVLVSATIVIFLIIIYRRRVRKRSIE